MFLKIFFLAVFLALVAIASASAVPPMLVIVPPDINGDSAVDFLDMEIQMWNYTKIATPTPATNIDGDCIFKASGEIILLSHLDLCKDGIINQKDVGLMIQWILIDMGLWQNEDGVGVQLSWPAPSIEEPPLPNGPQKTTWGFIKGNGR